MRTKKGFSFDEEKDAEEILQKGFGGKIDYGKMYIVAKYFRQMMGYGEIKLEREILRFCQEQDKNFNPVTEAEQIRKWIKSAMSYNLRKVDSVTISQKEIDFLRKIHAVKDRKLLFVSLVLSKAIKKRSLKRKQSEKKHSDNYYLKYNNFSDIIKLSGIRNVSEMDLARIFHQYKSNFKFYNPEKELIRLDFADPHSEGGIEIDNLSSLMDYYQLFFGKYHSVANCSVCGKEMVKTNNKQKMCKECSKTVRNEKQKELMRERRSSVSI